ncbi:DUF1694 domain-containing protein [Alkalibaculum sp. M08DMB]|uniref:DUF1694 domain-containing protein n=1 Tax=Alkalibaculum sporogenes TaxID=2655001 RepID=A0A6A7K9M4_9FIRM|nr:YueI family protein [Alkalibaculum sporogenes]MPW26096.1 DUF1694 domain-containing protein [Alkalibaculum sporogenes]
MNNKSELEKILTVGINGAPEFKYEEKILYLGEFRERVIRLLTKKQVEDPIVYPEIIESLNDKRVSKIVINGDINSRFSQKYEKLALKSGRRYTVVNNPDFKGETGLIVVSNNAVHIKNISVIDREVRLKNMGLSESLINAAGNKVCSNCLEKIVNANPNEAKNYKSLSLLSRVLGEHCKACGR